MVEVTHQLCLIIIRSVLTSPFPLLGGCGNSCVLPCRYFEGLQEELDTYDRVLYEMVADKRPRLFEGRAGRAKEKRWRPPKVSANRR